MKTFQYTALNAKNVFVKGKHEAKSLKRARAELTGSGLEIITVRYEPGVRLRWYNSTFSTVSRLDKIFFTSHLHTLLESGVALDQALWVTAEQASNPKFKAILLDMLGQIRRGQSLNSALAGYPKYFSNFYINLVRVGETSGNLSDTLFYLLEQQEKDHDILIKARGAMIYPSIIMTALVAMIIVMMVFVIPSVTGLLLQYKVQLPLATRVLIAVSNFITHWGIETAMALILAAVLLHRWVAKHGRGKWYWDGLLLHVPKLRQIIVEFNLARFARAMSSLLKSGIAIDQALNLAASVSDNSHYQKTIQGCVPLVRRGVPLGEIVRGYPLLYPPIASRMIEVGERTGRLDHMLGRLAAFYEKSVTTALGNISAIIEPVLLIGIGLSVGFVAIAILTPIWKFSQTV